MSATKPQTAKQKATTPPAVRDGWETHAFRSGWTKTTLYVRGRRQISYKYPSVETTFTSPMLSWENLQFAWPWGSLPRRNERLVAQVLAGKKPVGFAYPDSDTSITPWREQAQQAGCHLRTLPSRRSAPFDVGVACDGNVGGLFDLDSLIADYRAYLTAGRMPQVIIDRVEARLQSLRNRSLESFLDPAWNYSMPKVPEDHPQTGLLLGYPVASTVACMLGLAT